VRKSPEDEHRALPARAVHDPVADPVVHPHHLGLAAEADARRPGGQEAPNGSLDHPKQPLGPVGRPDLQLLKELPHETAETSKGAGQTRAGVNADDDTPARGDEHGVHPSGLVQGRVEDREEGLVEDVGTVLGGVLP